jgi:hypothetical protein
MLYMRIVAALTAWLLLLPAVFAEDSVKPAEPVQKLGYEGFWDHSYLAYGKGYLLRWDESGRGNETLYEPDGSQLYEVQAKPPERWDPFIYSAAVDSDGLAALAYRNGILILNQSGQIIRAIDTAAYRPSQLCFAPDHSLWVYGMDTVRPVRDYPVFRKYSPHDGQQLGAYVLRSQLPPKKDGFADSIAAPCIGCIRLHASNDRIGARMNADHAVLWVELDFSGNLLGQWKIERHHSPDAFTANNQVYAGLWEDGGRQYIETDVFDKAKDTWDRVEGVPLTQPIGADHEDLVYRMKTNPPISYLGWFVPSRPAQ